MLRLHLERAPHAVSGWLAGLADPVVATALTCLHRDPARSWTVADLADTAAVSRSTLAARFKATVGQGPLEYLTRWRIELAARQLREGNATLASIATPWDTDPKAPQRRLQKGPGNAAGDYRKHPTMP
ncbi:helix-turn-helix transcriptional regulator [Streptomyces lividans]